IHTNHLTRSFGLQRAVDRLTLDVPAGIIFGLLGPKGAGKTTLIRLLSGLLPPTTGTAQVLGYDVRTQAAAIHAHTGVLLEQAGLEEGLSAEATLALHAHTGPLALPEQQARIRMLLTYFGLWARRQETVGGWSLEMKRR